MICADPTVLTVNEETLAIEYIDDLSILDFIELCTQTTQGKRGVPDNQHLEYLLSECGIFLSFVTENTEMHRNLKQIQEMLTFALFQKAPLVSESYH